MNKIYKFFVTVVTSSWSWAIIIPIAILGFLGIYIAWHAVIQNISLFLAELIIVVILGIVLGALLAHLNVDIEINYLLSIVVFIAILIINCKILVNEEKIIYQILAYFSMAIPPIIYALLFAGISSLSYYIVDHTK